MTDVELDQALFEFDLAREKSKKTAIRNLSQIGSDLLTGGRIIGMEIHSEHDVHAYFRSSQDPDKVIHVQTYPGMSTQDNMAAVLREMDYQTLIEIRVSAKANGGPPIGNEHNAVTRNITEDFLISPVSEIVDLLNTELSLPTVIVDGQARAITPPRLIS